MNVPNSWMMALVLTAAWLPSARADVADGEYFLNSDPGPGQGTAFDIVDAPEATVTVTIPAPEIAALPEGLHLLGVRVRDADGDWSTVDTYPFVRLGPADPAPPPGALADGEYFIDADPGPGEGQAFGLPAGGSATKVATVPAAEIAALAPGLHFLGVRVRDLDGDWSTARTLPFYRVEPVGPTTGRTITRVTYQWFQGDQPASPVYEVFPNPQSSIVSLNVQASLQGLQEGGTYQLVATPYDNTGTAGIARTAEVLVQTTDSNGDGLPDQWKLTYGFGLNQEIAALDSDNDGVDNLTEFQNQTNPLQRDSDGDDLSDAAELGLAGFGFDPTVAQPDLVGDFRDSATAAELYGRDQIGALTLGAPTIERAQGSDRFSVNLRLKESTDLSQFDPVPFEAGGLEIRPDGSMDFEFDAPDAETWFMILEAE